MAVRSRIFTPVPGTTQIGHPSLYGVRMLGVSRSGDVLDLGTFPAAPGNHKYTYGLSTIYFDPTNPFNLGEKVWVIFET